MQQRSPLQTSLFFLESFSNDGSVDNLKHGGHGDKQREATDLSGTLCQGEDEEISIALHIDLNWE